MTSPRLLHFPFLTLILAFSWAECGLCSEEARRFQRVQPHMGTQFTITLYAFDQEAADKCFTNAFDRIAELDHLLSDYKSDSEINRLSASSPHSNPVPVSEDVWQILKLADRFSRKTNAAFDITVGPVTKLWRRARRRSELPPTKQLDLALQAVGYRFVEFACNQQAIRLTRPRMRLDLGGIAKGYALDQAMCEIQKNGIRAALINGGGDILASDAPAGMTGWKVAINSIDEPDQFAQTIWLRNQSIATSGDLTQYVEVDGTRYSHIVDPATGIGLTRRMNVTVLSADGTSADALASAVSVMGPAKGLHIIESIPGTEARIAFVDDSGTTRVRTSSGFGKLVSQPRK